MKWSEGFIAFVLYVHQCGFFFFFFWTLTSEFLFSGLYLKPLVGWFYHYKKNRFRRSIIQKSYTIASVSVSVYSVRIYRTIYLITCIKNHEVLLKINIFEGTKFYWSRTEYYFSLYLRTPRFKIPLLELSSL